MKLYGDRNPAPNPRRVRIFLAEKGIDLPETRVHMMKREHKAPEFLAKNSLGQIPVLELDDGTCIAETISICRYLEETQPGPLLFGETPLERAMIDMWIRRGEFQVMRPVSNAWVHDDERTAFLGAGFPEFGKKNRDIARRAMAWLNRELGDGRIFLTGPKYSMADISLLTTIDFARFINIDMPADVEHLRAWHARVSERPSAQA